MSGARGDPAGGVKDVLLLKSDRFSFECPVENGIQYDCPLGDDLAAFMKTAIERRDPTWQVLDPIREDFGSVLLLYRGKKCFNITITWFPLGDRTTGYEDVWFLQFSESHGCLGVVFRLGDDEVALTDLRRLVAEIVVAETAVFRSASWLAEREFAETTGVKGTRKR
jgi:hypothetical protein